MPSLKWSELVDWLEAVPVGSPRPRPDRKVSVCTDSRSLAKGQVFWVLKGDRFDGHDFVQQAFDRGGIAAVVANLVGGLVYASVGSSALFLVAVVTSLASILVAMRYLPGRTPVIAGASL